MKKMYKNYFGILMMLYASSIFALELFDVRQGIDVQKLAGIAGSLKEKECALAECKANISGAVLCLQRLANKGSFRAKALVQSGKNLDGYLNCYNKILTSHKYGHLPFPQGSLSHNAHLLAECIKNYKTLQEERSQLMGDWNAVARYFAPASKNDVDMIGFSAMYDAVYEEERLAQEAQRARERAEKAELFELTRKEALERELAVKAVCEAQEAERRKAQLDALVQVTPLVANGLYGAFAKKSMEVKTGSPKASVARGRQHESPKSASTVSPKKRKPRKKKAKSSASIDWSEERIKNEEHARKNGVIPSHRVAPDLSEDSTESAASSASVWSEITDCECAFCRVPGVTRSFMHLRDRYGREKLFRRA